MPSELYYAVIKFLSVNEKIILARFLSIHDYVKMPSILSGEHKRRNY